MKRNCLKICVTFLCFAFLLILSGKVNATTAPELKKFDNKEFFFANGTEITIEQRTDGLEGAKIIWNGGSQLVGKDANIFGGMHNDNTEVNTSITMNGGTVRNIIGGGMHLSNTNKSRVTINAGQVVSVQGGGASSLNHNCGCSNGTTWYAGAATKSPCQTNEAIVKINGGVISSLVFGGGEGISNTNNVNVIITGGNLETAYVTAAGSNGNTTNASLEITGGNIYLVQTVNRGTLSDVDLKVTGGNIENLYVGGEDDTNVTGTITGGASISLSGNAKVKTMKLGKNGNAAIDITTGNIKAEDIKIVDGIVQNKTDLGNVVTTIYKVRIDGTEYLIEEGKTIKDIPEYESLIKKEGYKFNGFKKDGKNYDVNEIVTGNIDLTISFEKIKEENQTNNTNNENNTNNSNDINNVVNSEKTSLSEKDVTPKTGLLDIVLYTFISISAISLAAIVMLKKYNR